MCSALRSIAVAALLVAACKSGPQPVEAAGDPAASGTRHPHAVVRPMFMVGDKQLHAGTGFVIRAQDRGPVLITAQHLFSPAGGLERTIAWQDMPRAVRSVYATSLDDQLVIVAGGAPLAIEGAEGMSEARLGGDVALFPLTTLGGAVQPLELAAAPPRVGDRVTLLAEVYSGGTGLRHGATVLEVGADHVAYVFDEPIELRATSGAPVVDASERVVAINLGGRDLEDGRIVGLGNSIASFGPAIQRALAAAPARR